MDDIEASFSLERRFGYGKHGINDIAEGFFSEVQEAIESAPTGGRREAAKRIFDQLRGAGFVPGGVLARYGRLLRLSFNPDGDDNHQLAPLEKAAKQAHTLAMLVGCGWIEKAGGPFATYYEPRTRARQIIDHLDLDQQNGIQADKMRFLMDILAPKHEQMTIYGRNLSTPFGTKDTPNGDSLDTWQGIALHIYNCKYFKDREVLSQVEWMREFCDLLLIPYFTKRPYQNSSNSDAMDRVQALMKSFLPLAE